MSEESSEFDQELMKDWEERRKEPLLWGAASSIVYNTIKKNSINNSIKKLKEMRKRYKGMSSSSYYVQAINELNLCKKVKMK